MGTAKTFLCFIWACVMVTCVSAQYISEFHYDNTGSDEGEFIEVAIPNPQPIMPSEYKIFIYNGGDSMVHKSRGLQDIKTGCKTNLCYYVWSIKSLLQNDTEAIALVRVTDSATTVFGFISYEGNIEALDGPVMGMTSMDIGISESDSTPVGWSLQKRIDSTWFAGPSTRGSVNPIELLTFTGRYMEDQNGVLLEWSTASELNNHYFEVQKSRDQQLFLKLGEISGAGNSQEFLQYNFFDPDPQQGTFYYRLKQVDFGGAYTYSPVISVKILSASDLTEMVPIMQNGAFYFKNTRYRPAMNISFYNTLGKLLFHGSQIHAGDIIPVNFPVDGIIFVQLRSQGLQHTGRIVFIGQ